jgi:hypothetical protein
MSPPRKAMSQIRCVSVSGRSSGGAEIKIYETRAGALK